MRSALEIRSSVLFVIKKLRFVFLGFGVTLIIGAVGLFVWTDQLNSKLARRKEKLIELSPDFSYRRLLPQQEKKLFKEIAEAYPNPIVGDVSIIQEIIFTQNDEPLPYGLDPTADKITIEPSQFGGVEPIPTKSQAPDRGSDQSTPTPTKPPKKNPTPTPTPTPTPGECTDTDGGKDYYTKGTLTTSYGDQKTDFCSDPNIVYEYYCSKTVSFAGGGFICPSGVCQDGACAREENLPPSQPVCGNGVVEEGEECDDGNDDDHSDGCLSNCEKCAAPGLGAQVYGGEKEQCCSGLVKKNGLCLDPPPEEINKPDLGFGAFYLTVGRPKTGSHLKFLAEIKNKGDASIEANSYQVRIDVYKTRSGESFHGENLFNTMALGPGEVWELYFEVDHHFIDPAEYRLTVNLDYRDNIDESWELNNSLSITFTVEPKKCFDVDGGENFEVKSCVDSGHYQGTYVETRCDECDPDNDQKLFEYVCAEDELHIKKVEHDCPVGCQDGRCLSSEEVGCFDSDGIDYYRYGAVTISDGTVIDDECVADWATGADPNHMREYSCQAVPEGDPRVLKRYYDSNYELALHSL